MAAGAAASEATMVPAEPAVEEATGEVEVEPIAGVAVPAGVAGGVPAGSTSGEGAGDPGAQTDSTSGEGVENPGGGGRRRRTGGPPGGAAAHRARARGLEPKEPRPEEPEKKGTLSRRSTCASRCTHDE